MLNIAGQCSLRWRVNFASPMVCCNSKCLYYILQFNIICAPRPWVLHLKDTVLLLREPFTLKKNSKPSYPGSNISYSLYHIFAFRVFCFNCDWLVWWHSKSSATKESPPPTPTILVNYFLCLLFICLLVERKKERKEINKCCIIKYSNLKVFEQQNKTSIKQQNLLTGKRYLPMMQLAWGWYSKYITSS